MEKKNFHLKIHKYILYRRLNLLDLISYSYYFMARTKTERDIYNPVHFNQYKLKFIQINFTIR